MFIYIAINMNKKKMSTILLKPVLSIIQKSYTDLQNKYK